MLMRKFLMAGGLSAILVLGACGGEENTDSDSATETDGEMEHEDRGEDIEEEEGEDDASTE